MIVETYDEYVARCKAMIEKMKPYKDARVDQIPTELAMVLIANRWMNCWMAINELEKLIFRYKPRRSKHDRQRTHRKPGNGKQDAS